MGTHPTGCCVARLPTPATNSHAPTRARARPGRSWEGGGSVKPAAGRAARGPTVGEAAASAWLRAYSRCHTRANRAGPASRVGLTRPTHSAHSPSSTSSASPPPTAATPAPQSSSNSTCTQGITLRRANAKDLFTIQRLVVTEYMNPLGLDWERFVVAEDVRGRVVGIGQLKEYGVQWDAATAAAAAPAAEQGGGFYELRSLVVLPEMRGRGIGSALVRALLGEGGAESGLGASARQGGEATAPTAAVCAALSHPVYLLTIASRQSFYTTLGFSQVDAQQVPPNMRVELFLGNIVARLAVGDNCICMKLK